MVKKLPSDCMPSCKNCSFLEREPKDDMGFCRRYPPVIINSGEDDYESILPVVSLNDWCGEFNRFVN
jgi:hypothetical protein